MHSPALRAVTQCDFHRKECNWVLQQPHMNNAVIAMCDLSLERAAERPHMNNPGRSAATPRGGKPLQHGPSGAALFWKALFPKRVGFSSNVCKTGDFLDKRQSGTGDMRQATGGQKIRQATFRQAFLPITYPHGEKSVLETQATYMPFDSKRGQLCFYEKVVWTLLTLH